MIKQVKWSENRVVPQQVPTPESEMKHPPVQWSENQVISQQESGSTSAVKAKTSVNSSPNVVESVGAIPNEIYDRLGLSVPRWLLWVRDNFIWITRIKFGTMDSSME